MDNRDEEIARLRSENASLLISKERLEAALGEIAGCHDDWDDTALSRVRQVAFDALHPKLATKEQPDG